ncbi:MAG: alpha/beta hydrolase [Chloroflexi bacterium]|nr:alpha/beta hydrolase [Chloroflexota bacterium]
MKIIKRLVTIFLGFLGMLVALFALGYVLTIGDHTVPATVAQDPSLPSITINGYAYHGETYGNPENPVVITLHGGPGSDYRSILNLQELADEYYVIFFDQRGAGLSPRVSPEEITLESAIVDLDSIVDYYGKGQKVNLVGHSWGAMLASAYLGQHPEKVEHVVLAEPGFLTTEFLLRFQQQTQLKFTPGVITHFLKTKFESLHVMGVDDHAMDDYFTHHINLYQGEDHPQAGYYCPNAKPDPEGSWRFGATAASSIQASAIDAEGDINLNLVEGVEIFTNQVLFIAGECQTYIGADWQREQMEFFPNAELVVIPDAGHEMFAENPEDSITAVREYLND